MTIQEDVLDVIERHDPKYVRTSTIMEETGYTRDQVSDAIEGIRTKVPLERKRLAVHGGMAAYRLADDY